MSKRTISKIPAILKSFLLRSYKKKIYLRNLEQDFISQRNEIDSLKRQLRLIQL